IGRGGAIKLVNKPRLTVSFFCVPRPAAVAMVLRRSAAKRRLYMFITRKHISRRTVLKGAGVAVALPFLEAMVPAATAIAQTAASPKLRAGFFYIPHGAIMYNTAHGPSMDRWTPSGSGADLKLNTIMQPLEPFKKYVSSVGHLVNDASAGSV